MSVTAVMGQWGHVTVVMEKGVARDRGGGGRGAKKGTGAVGGGRKDARGCGGENRPHRSREAGVTRFAERVQRILTRRWGARTELPAGVTGLDTGLAHVKRDGFAHFEGVGGGVGVGGWC